MMSVASAKVILFGEHSVVHGRLAVAAAISRGARANARAAAGGSTLEIAPWGRVAHADEDGELGRAFMAILTSMGAKPIEVRVEVDVPGGAGLGCSAAIGVALVRAIAEHEGRRVDDAEVSAHASAWERVFHGNPSGIDVAVASSGGVVQFRRGQPPERVRPAAAMEIAIASTGEACSTRAMVERVARQLERRPQVVERTFDGIDTLAKRGVEAIEAARWYEVGRLMDLNHALLASLMVSTERLELACNVARNAGALGAKLTGGGGGGCAIAIAPGCSAAVIEAWRAAGIDGFVAQIAASPTPMSTVAEAAP